MNENFKILIEKAKSETPEEFAGLTDEQLFKEAYKTQRKMMETYNMTKGIKTKTLKEWQQFIKEKKQSFNKSELKLSPKEALEFIEYCESLNQKSDY